MAGYLPAHIDPATTERQCAALVAAGIRRIIDLTEEGEANHQGIALAPYEEAIARSAAANGCSVLCRRISIPDFGVPDRGTMMKILDAIDDGVRADEPVYIHCWGGRGRTGTVIGCWLRRHGYGSGDEVLARIRALRAGVPDEDYPSPETDEQRRMVKEWTETRSGVPAKNGHAHT
jgi:hypothetical protein